MENSNYYSSVQQTQKDDLLKIQEWFTFCRFKWHWFVISVGLMLTLAMAYIVTQQPMYLRVASVLVKQDKSSSLSSDFSALSFGIPASRTNLYNEMFTFGSPTYMRDVVKHLNLDMNYSKKGRFHDNVLYGKNLPIKVALQDVDEEDFASLTIDFEKPDKVILSNFLNSQLEEVSLKQVKGKIGSLFETPIGRVLVTLTNNDPQAFPDERIMVKRLGVTDATNLYTSRLKVDMPELKASIIQLSIMDASSFRSFAFLGTVSHSGSLASRYWGPS